MGTRSEASPIGCLIILVMYIAAGGAVHLVAYGPEGGSALSLFVVAVLWPGALVWWSLWYLLIAAVLGLAALGVRSIWRAI